MPASVKTRREKFTEVYRANAWQGSESVSGPGSDLGQTAGVRAALPALLRDLGVKSFVDAPCGDFHWMKDVVAEMGNGDTGVEYIGVDIVEELVERLNTAHGRGQGGRGGRRFECRDLVTEILPRADLILCRDCLVHLPLHEVVAGVRNFVKSGAMWLLTTTFPATKQNADVRWSGWRPLNLEIAPFNFSEPERVIVEGCTEQHGQYADKSLGLWRLENLRGI